MYKNKNMMSDIIHNKRFSGESKSNYITHYINIDSSYREKLPSIKISHTYRLGDHPIVINGSKLCIAIDDGHDLKINDQITINDIQNKSLIVRSFIIDMYGNKIEYFKLEENKQYMTITADINIWTGNNFTTTDIQKINVILEGMMGDKKTDWYFDTTKFSWTTIPINTTQYLIQITENVHAVLSSSSGLLEDDQIPIQMLIAEFIMDEYGTIQSITQVPYPTNDMSWTDPISYTGNIIPLPPIQVPAQYIQGATNSLIANNLYNPPPLPGTFYDVMKYFEDVQNIIRPIFFLNITTQPNNCFVLQYEKYDKTYDTEITIVDPMTTRTSITQSIGNQSLNVLNTLHQVFLSFSDLQKSFNIVIPSTPINQDTMYVRLNTPYHKKKAILSNPLNTGALCVTVYENTRSDVKIIYDHYGGIPVTTMNAQHIIEQITDTQIIVDLGKNGYYNQPFGGNIVYIGLIDSMISGYPDPYSYQIYLEKIYTNIVMVRMVGSIFPKTQYVIRRSINNKFYWQNNDDGEIIYSIELDPGNYDMPGLKQEFEQKVKTIKRINDSWGDPYNDIELDFDISTQNISFTNYTKYMPNNSDTFIKQITIQSINEMSLDDLDDSDSYYRYPDGLYYMNFTFNSININSIRITINHPHHNLSIKETIYIENSLNYGFIPAQSINQPHIITNIIDVDHYDILLHNVNFDLSLSEQISGGVGVVIYTQNLFRIYFNYPDTFGKELGFRHVGSETSITPYQTTITNSTWYQYEINKQTPCYHNAINLHGAPYFLIRCKELSNCVSVGNIKDYFYKINLDTCPGTLAYDSYVDTPLFFDDMLWKLDKLSFDLVNIDGSYYDSNNIDHSFVLEITTFEEWPDATNIRVH